jgi:hypothetical protein
LLLLFYHTNPVISRDRVTDIPGAFERIRPDYIVLSPLSREILSRLSPQDKGDFDAYMQEETRLVATIENGAYGRTEIYEVDDRPDQR